MRPEEIELKSYIDSITRVKDEFWEELSKSVRVSYLKKGEQFAKEGDKVKSIGFLLSGIIRIYYLDEEGNEWNKAFLESNSFLISNIDLTGDSQVYFEAAISCKILIASSTLFEDGLVKFPELHKVYQHEMGKLFKRKSEREVSLLKYNAKERFVQFKNTYPNVVARLPQYHIASYLGITPTQLSRIKISIQNQQM